MSQSTPELVEIIDRESNGTEHDHTSLRLWLRLLTCTMMIENCVKKGLRSDFETTLPRFDLMAQLARNPEGLKMGDLSQRMMVSGGNITGITDQLEKEELVERLKLAGDRRVYRVRLTAKGQETFRAMAAIHEDWIVDWMSDLTLDEQHLLHSMLGKLKKSLQEKGCEFMKRSFADDKPQHFRWQLADQVATITLDRPEKKNPLTFESYAELRDLFRDLVYASDVKVVVLTGAGGNFCSGGDVHEIIGPLTEMTMPDLLDFTRMTGDLVKAIRACPQPIISVVDGVCVGAGAILAMASDLRYGTPTCKTAFLFTRVGLAGCDMGACSILPRIIGQGRASELLYTGRSMTAEEGERWGFYNALYSSEEVLAKAQQVASQLAHGPTFAHAMTKKMLHQEWSMGIDEAIEAEAQAQAICMQTRDFRRAYEAFVAKEKPVFEGD